MEEAYEEAVKEIKRVDHLFYVSLKYTRTVDMMKHMLDRLISMFEHGVEALLRKAKAEKVINEIPQNQALKTKLLMEINKDEELHEHMNFYLRLRKINRASYTKREEFRRHVTMTASIDGGEIVEINIDVLKEFYDTAKNFLLYIKVQIHGEDEY